MPTGFAWPPGLLQIYDHRTRSKNNPSTIQYVDQIFLVCEVPVDCSGPDLCLFGDQRHGDAVKPSLGEKFQGCLQNGFAFVLARISN